MKKCADVRGEVELGQVVAVQSTERTLVTDP